MARVLIVDDSPFMISLLRSLFEKAGHEVVAEAADGIHAYMEYEKHKPDMVTLDLNMPLLNGIDTIGILLESFPDANIIVISSEQNRDTITDCIKKGANHYIIKPVSIEKIKTAVTKVLQSH
ncbi:MAG: response regulator [Candidatus Cloacimonetes bacterium]|nr:response regulator [Candidatus Cloacimonadota bacterium]